MSKRKTAELYTFERRMLFSALSFVVVASCVYMYFLCATVVHVVVRKEIGQQMAAVSSEISVLESEYIETQHSVSADIASMRGFGLATNKTFIEPAQTTFVLSKLSGS